MGELYWLTDEQMTRVSPYFPKALEALSAQRAEPQTIMIGTTYLKVHRTASSFGKKDLRRLIGRAKGGMNTELHAVTDANGRPLSFFIMAEQISDYPGGEALFNDLPKAK